MTSACPACGAPHNMAHQFCPACGESLQALASQPIQRAPANPAGFGLGNWLLATLAAALAVAIMVVTVVGLVPILQGSVALAEPTATLHASPEATQRPSLRPTPGPTPTGRPAVVTPRPAPAESAGIVFQLKGGGTANTQPFHLAKSFAAIALVATDPDGYGCVFIVDLVTVGGSIFDTTLVANELVGDGERIERTTYFYGGPGDFYFDINSTCSWGVGVVE